MFKKKFAIAALSAAVISVSSAQTSVTGNGMAFKSSGAVSGTGWNLTQNGYVGTYLTVPAGGATVNFTINASATASTAAAPHMNLVVADSAFGFTVSSTSATNYSTAAVTLPAGTYFVRNERDYSGNTASPIGLGIGSVSVNTISGGAATFNNTATDANALASSNTYIDNFRKGPATLNLRGPGNVPLLAGTPVHVDMARNAFNFGGTVSGSTNGDSKDMLGANPAVGSEAYKFQQFINSHFNIIVPSNGGKWANNEATSGNFVMTLVDKQLDYAAAHNMRARMHNLIWGSGATSGNQQPAFVNTLISSAAGGNTASKASLNAAIASRINYYVGTTGNRSQKYIEIDGLNEALHNPSYWNIDQPSGIAAIYNQVVAAAASAGNASLRIYLNEYNVIQFSPNSISNTGLESGSDQYANWYRNEVEAIRNAGGAMGGIGVQEYANVTTTGSNSASANTVQKAMQNLSVEGLPITMAEFGLASGTTKANSQSLGPQVMEDTMRMFYGNPLATSFLIWGWWDLSAAAYPPAALLDNSQGNNALTPMGTRWEQLMNQWDTNTTATANAQGSIAFSGFYGDYYLRNQTAGAFDLTLAKGTTSYDLNLSVPQTWSIWNPGVSGTWSGSGNWTAGGVANGAGQTAYFGPAGASRSISVSGAETVGMMVFDSTASYAVGGAGTITMQGFNSNPGHVAAINVVRGTHSIGAPLALVDDTTIAVGSGGVLTIAAAQSGTVALTKTGVGTLVLNNLRQRSLTVSGGIVQISGSSTSILDSLPTVAASAQFDLNADDLIVRGENALAARDQIGAGYHDGAWDGTGGITSSSARNQADGLTAIGYAGAGDVFGIAPTDTAIFDGVNVSGSDLLIKYTWYGDNDLSGVVDQTSDLTLYIIGLNGGGSTWIEGDYNYDGMVDQTSDLTLFIIGLNSQTGTLGGAGGPMLGAAIPEPCGLVWIGASGIVLRRRRAKR